MSFYSVKRNLQIETHLVVSECTVYHRVVAIFYVIIFILIFLYTVSCTFTYHAWQFVSFTIFTITACIFSYSLSISF